MADGVFNVAKGRVIELHNRVDNNDPATAGIVVVLLASTGLVTDAVMRDYATLADVLAGASDEATNTNYARKILTDADVGPITVDLANDRTAADIADQVWSNVAADGSGPIGKLLVCYDPVLGSGTDAQIEPLTYHDFVVTPNGGNITATIADYFRAL